MNSLLRRLLFAGVGLMLLLVAFTLGRKLLLAEPAGEPVAIAEFALPDLPGWKRSAKPKYQFVTYKQARGRDELFIMFAANKPSPENARKTVLDLQRESAKSHQEMAAKLAKQGSKLQWSPPEAIDLNGIAAVETRSATFDKSVTQYTRQRKFIRSSRPYFLNSIISVSPTDSPAPPAKYQREIDEAVEKIAASLHDGSANGN